MGRFGAVMESIQVRFDRFMEPELSQNHDHGMASFYGTIPPGRTHSRTWRAHLIAWAPIMLAMAFVLVFRVEPWHGLFFTMPMGLLTGVMQGMPLRSVDRFYDRKKAEMDARHARNLEAISRDMHQDFWDKLATIRAAGPRDMMN